MRDAAEAALASPARLQEIGVERLDLVRAQERHRMLSQRPTEDDETHEAVESSRQALADCESVLSSAQSGRRDQEAALAQAGKTRDGALEKVAQVDASITANERDISLLQQQLTPARGSLLAFLRESPDEAWAAGAKILDPALLARTDLNPRFGLQGTDLPQPSDVSVNALVIDTGGLAKPAWIDMADLQLQMKSLEERAKKLGKERTDAGALAKKASTARTEAAAMLATLQQTEVMAQTARDNAAHALKRWEGHARVLREACKVQADADLKKIAGKLVTLQFEEDGLKSDDTRARAALRADFAGQFRRLDADAKAGRERLEQERKDAATQLQEQIARITADVDREAAGRGVDTKRMAGLQARIDAARTRLDAIASHGHHVRAWRKFQRDVAPLMEAARLDRDRRHTLMVSVKRQLATAEAERVAYSTASRTERVGLESVITTQQGWIDALGLLLKGPLHRFLTHVPESLHIDWSLDSLAESVRNRLFALDTDLETLRTETRKLREVMVERPGGPQDFLLLREREHTDPQRLLEHQGAVEKAESVAAWFDLMAYGPYVDGMNKEMDSIFSIASIFVQDLESFDRRVITFNHELQRALQETATFARFQDLSVSVRSGVGKINYLETLREMRDTSHSRGSVTRSVSIVDRELPREEDVRLMERFHGLLPDDGLFRVNLSDQVRLECSLIENGKRRVITNEEEFRGVSSNGNTALIIAMFLMGFVQMIRGKGSQVRVTWIADEVGRFDIGNLSAFLQTLDAHNIDVISASPSIDPEIARHFSRLCVFEGNGSIQTSTTEITELDLEESAYAQA